MQEQLKASFRPNISIMSQKLAAGTQRPSSAYQLLYDDALKRREKQQNPPAVEFTFTPSLTQLDPKLFHGVDKPTGKNSLQYPCLFFFFSISQIQKTHTSNRSEIEKKQKEECTFKPKINEAPQAVKDRAAGHGSVGEYLHSVHQKYTEKVEKKKEEEEKQLKEMAKKRFTRGKSIELLGKAEKEKLLEIFNALDADQDGAISAAKIDITRTNFFCHSY